MTRTTSFVPRRSSLLLWCLLAVIALLAACGGSDGAAEADGDSPTTPTAVEAATADPDAEQQADAPPAADSSGSPIDDLLGIPIMDEAAMNDYFIDVISEGERLTAECMIGEGFEYTPERPSVTGPSVRENTDTRDYAERVGYGLVVGFIDATVDASTQLPPNVEYLESLSDGEREAYSVALFGARTDETGTNNGIASVGGCKALALAELTDVFGVMEQFSEPALAVFDQYDADPRMIASAKAWTECMAEAGYIAPDRDEVQDLLQPLIEPILQQGDAIYVDDPTFDPARYNIGGDWSRFLSGDTFGAHPPLTTEALEQVDEVAAFEIELAVADFDCFEPLREAEREVLLEYEQLLVDRIGDEVTAALSDE